MNKEREIAELICDMINEIAQEKREYYVNEWNRILDKYKGWKK